MPDVSIIRPNRRKALYLSKGVGRMNLIFPLESVEKGELDQLVRAILAKGGVTNEAEVQAVIERAELDYEVRVKVAEARAEVRRLLALRWQGLSLIQSGFRKWKEAFFPAVKTFVKE